MAALFYYICKELILKENTKYRLLIINFFVFLAGFAIALITVTKGLKNILKQQDLILTFGDSAFYSAIAALVFTAIFYIFSRARLSNSSGSQESQFAYLMVFTSCAVAFAHGSNDVANAIGPLAAIHQATNQILGMLYRQKHLYGFFS